MVCLQLCLLAGICLQDYVEEWQFDELLLPKRYLKVSIIIMTFASIFQALFHLF